MRDLTFMEKFFQSHAYMLSHSERTRSAFANGQN